MGSTVAEKVLADAAGEEAVEPGDHVVCSVDFAMANDTNGPRVIDAFEEMGADRVWDPSRVAFVMDHIAPSHTVADANAKKRLRAFADEQGIEAFYDVGEGISHEVLPERGHVRPGEFVVGADSHTTSFGAFGAAGTGVGGVDLAFVLATGENWFRVPESIRIEVDGAFPPRVSPKDLLLSLAGEHGTGMARYRSIEYGGPAVRELAIDDRFTLANMGIELGAKFAFTPVDDRVFEYVDARTDEPYEPARADSDAGYERTYRVDASTLEPLVATPHDVGNVVPVGEVAGTDLDQVFIGSCTHGKYADLAAAADVLGDRAVDPGTRVVVTPASREVYARAEREGLLGRFVEAGAVVTNPTCGACIGRGMGVLGDDEVCLAAMNRNFKGRMGADSSAIYLSSPETAAASAIRGKIADPRGV